MKKALPLVDAQEKIAGRGAPGNGAPPPSALALLAALGDDRERMRGRKRWMPGGRALAGAGPGAASRGDAARCPKCGRADMGCNCAPMAPEGLVDLEPNELSGAPVAEAGEPVPIYNAPALAPTEASRREAISGAPVYAKVETRPAADGGAARRPVPLGIMALATGGPTRGRAGWAVGQTPTTPPAPVPAGGPVPGPFPPPTYQSPGQGLVPVGRPAFLTPADLAPEPAGRCPGGRRTVVGQPQVRRLRRLAEEVIIVVRAGSRAGAGTAAERLAARAFLDCMDRMTSAVGDFGRVVARLRKADDAGTGAELLLDEAAALEAFADCATDILARARGS